MIHIMQGDAYPVMLTVRDGDGQTLTPDDIKVLEVMIGSILKSFPASIRWEADAGKFAVPLTQEETLSLTPGVQAVQARALGVDMKVNAPIAAYITDANGYYPATGYISYGANTSTLTIITGFTGTATQLIIDYFYPVQI